MPMTYPLTNYASMIADEGRFGAYAQAIRQTVEPGSMVIELGTATGLMAFLACQAGARKVIALDPSETIAIAQQTARDNGLAERVEFLPRLSTAFTPAEKADVLISDLRGTMPCFQRHLLDIADARERLLKPGGTLICQTDTLQVCVVEDEPLHRQLVGVWEDKRWGFDLRAALKFAPHQFKKVKFKADQMLSAARSWATIHYPTVSTPHVRGAASLEVTRPGTGHALGLWFDAELAGGAKFSNAPTEPNHVYGRQILGWPQAVALLPGDRVEVKLDAIFNEGDYVWNWATRITRASAVLAEFKQSTLQGRVMSAEMLARKSGGYRPQPSVSLTVEKFLLDRINGRTTNAELAAALRSQFPQAFPTEAAALNRVVQLVEKLAEA